jgi:hypothetical protein
MTDVWVAVDFVALLCSVAGTAVAVWWYPLGHLPSTTKTVVAFGVLLFAGAVAAPIYARRITLIPALVVMLLFFPTLLAAIWCWPFVSLALWLKIALTIAAFVIPIPLAFQAIAYLGRCTFGYGGHYFAFCALFVLVIVTFVLGNW